MSKRSLKRPVQERPWIPLQPAKIPQSEIDRLKNIPHEDKMKLLPEGSTIEDFDAFIEKMATEEEVWMNDQYQVALRDAGEGMTHLSIKRRDKQAVHDWRHFQRIKNELCGPEREGIELYPAESRLVDSANQYHLWVFPEGFILPVGFKVRWVNDEPTLHKAVQRPREE